MAVTAAGGRQLSSSRRSTEGAVAGRAAALVWRITP
jgi:hypothetical protein